MVTSAVQTDKFCELCLQSKPISEFRRRTRGGTARMRECRHCHNALECERRADQRHEQRDKTIGRFVSRLKNTTDRDRMILICSTMVEHFGGVQKFVQSWKGHIDRARQERRGGKKALDFFLAVAHMSQFCQPSLPHVNDMSREELQHELTEETKRTIIAEPELAIHAAQQLGWTVIPPELSQDAMAPCRAEIPGSKLRCKPDAIGEAASLHQL